MVIMRGTKELEDEQGISSAPARLLPTILAGLPTNPLRAHLPACTSPSSSLFPFPNSRLNLPFSSSNSLILISNLSICSCAPTLNFSMILKNRHKRSTTTREATSSSVPCRRTSVKKPMTMTRPSKVWKREVMKYLFGRRM